MTLAGDMRVQVKADITRFCVYYSITSHIWTARNARSYIAFTIHYLDDEFDFVSWTLEVKVIPGKHDGAAIAAALQLIMDDWGLSKDLCCRIVRDSGSYMVSAGNIVGADHAACIAHELHLIVSGLVVKKKKERQSVPAWEAVVSSEVGAVLYENKEDDELSENDRLQMGQFRDAVVEEIDSFLDEALENLGKGEMGTMRGIVQNFRILAVHFRKTPKARARLEYIQNSELGISPDKVVTFKVDCPTRWNSYWDMLMRCIRLQPALNAYLQTPSGVLEFKDMKNKLKRPKDADWFAIKCLKQVLNPFGEVTRVLGGQGYPTLPFVLPVLVGLRIQIFQEVLFENEKHLAGDEDYVDEAIAVVKECRKTVLRLFNRRFYHLADSELTWVSYLDPHVARYMKHLSDEEKIDARRNLVDAAAQLCRDEVDLTERGLIFFRQPVHRKSTGFINSFALGPGDTDLSSNTLEQDCSNEFTRHLADITAPKAVQTSTEPCEWWRFIRNKYPSLSKLARKWLSAVASSVPSERAFSTAGCIVTVKR